MPLLSRTCWGGKHWEFEEHVNLMGTHWNQKIPKHPTSNIPHLPLKNTIGLLEYNMLAHLIGYKIYIYNLYSLPFST
jgi:hypothetical protein